METKEQKQISPADRDLMPGVVIDGNMYVPAEDAVKAVQNARARVADQRCDELRSVQKQLVEALEGCKWLFEQDELKPLMSGQWGDPAVVADKVNIAILAAKASS